MSSPEGGAPDAAGEKFVQPDPSTHPDYPPHIDFSSPPSSETGVPLRFKYFDFQEPGGYSSQAREGSSYSSVDEAHHASPGLGCPAQFPEEYPATLDAVKGPDGTFSVQPKQGVVEELRQHALLSYQDYLRRVRAQNEAHDEQVTPPQVTLSENLSDGDPAEAKVLGIQPYLQRRISAAEIPRSLGQVGRPEDEVPNVFDKIIQERNEEVGMLYKAAKGEPADLPEPFQMPLEAFNYPDNSRTAADLRASLRRIDEMLERERAANSAAFKPGSTNFEELYRQTVRKGQDLVMKAGDGEIKKLWDDLLNPAPSLIQGRELPVFSDVSGPLTPEERKVVAPEWTPSDDDSYKDVK